MEKKSPASTKPDKKEKALARETKKKELLKKIEAASTKEELSAAATPEELAEVGLRHKFSERMKALGGETKKELKKTGEDKKKRVAKAGGDPAKVDAATEKAVSEAEEAETEGEKEAAAVLEEEGSSLEGETHVSPEIHESRKAAEEAELKGTPPTTETPTEGTKPAPGTPRPAPEVLVALEANMGVARERYFAVYKRFNEQRGFLSNLKTKVFGGEVRPEDIAKKNPELARELAEAKSIYNASLVEMGKAMSASGKTAPEIMEKLVIGEKALRNQAEVKLVPEKVANIVARAGEAYMKIQPAWKRQAISTGIMTAGMIASGHLAAGGVIGYVGTRVVRAYAGQAAVWLKNRFWKSAEDDVKKIGENFNEQTKSADAPMSLSVLEGMQKQYEERLKKERSARLKHLAIDVGLRVGVGLGTGWGINHFTGGGAAVEDIKPSPDQGSSGGQSGHDLMPWQQEKNALEEAKKLLEDTKHPHGNFDFKEIKVEYSSRGAIDTWAHVKHELKDAYQGVSPDKIPPAYKHIMESRADDLAKEFGDWRPDQANESLNMLKGSSIEFDKEGNVISHSLRNVSGAATNDSIMNMKPDGTYEVIKQGDERFFDYQGGSQHIEPTRPDFENNDTITPTEPKFESGIPEHPHDHDWRGQRFESHASSHDGGHDSTPGDQHEDGRANYPYDKYGRKHGRVWWNRHPDGIDEKYEAKLARQEFRNFNPTNRIDQAFAQTAYADGGSVGYQPIMDPANPGGMPGGYQHVEHYANSLTSQQVTRILNNTVRFVGNDFLERAAAAHDPAYPLYKVLHDLQEHGYKFGSTETVQQYLGRVRIESQAGDAFGRNYFATMDPARFDWFVRNGFFR